MNLSPEEARKNSIKYLQEHSIPYSEHLPLLEEHEELSPQNSQAVARRCFILSHVIGIGFDANVSRLRNHLIELDYFKYASTKEKLLLMADTHTKQEMIDATWLTECVQSLAWCLSLVELDPFKNCDNDLADNFPPPLTDPAQFIQTSKLRPIEEIYQQADLHYQLHWATRDSRITGGDFALNEGLTRERRKALEWVIGVEAEWDEIPLNT